MLLYPLTKVAGCFITPQNVIYTSAEALLNVLSTLHMVFITVPWRFSPQYKQVASLPGNECVAPSQQH